MKGKSYNKKVCKSEKQVIFAAYIVEARALGYSYEAIGQGLALIEQALDSLEDIAEFG